MPYFCLFLSRSKIKHMVKKEAVFSDKLDYAFLLNNINEEEDRGGGGEGGWGGGGRKRSREGRKTLLRCTSLPGPAGVIQYPLHL